MDLKPFPGYERHLSGYLRDAGPAEEGPRAAPPVFRDFPEGMRTEDRVIPGGDGQEMKIRLYIPKGLPERPPVVLDIHGGGFVAGDLDTDNYRCAAIAARVPAIVAGVEYRLSGKGVHFPAPLMDCHAAWQWLCGHAEAIGADSGRMGLHGSSAGGNLAAGLALYLRDHNEQPPALAVLNCATYTPAIEETMSFQQLRQLRMGPDNKALNAEAAYLGGYDGTRPSYYAFPALSPDLGDLCPHFIIAGEYDTLRDSALDYAGRLLRSAVPTELFLAGRQGHCFTAVPHPFTDLTHDLIAAAFRREFGLLNHLSVQTG